MELTERALVQAAGAVARLRTAAGRHAVATAVLSADGRVFTGVDVRHDAAGACAEVVAVGTAATQGVRELSAIVTVGDRGRELREPCPGCRRLLADWFPGIRVVLGTPDELRAVPVEELAAGQSPAA
ncbi:cytidine deaminase [Plantactinospora siamensis]|uniref:Cytidine deaminase n=1 Tax=Plantactinospora siamensis TaxID=555372 RepID=A0ABV6P1P6_9ACTN